MFFCLHTTPSNTSSITILLAYATFLHPALFSLQEGHSLDECSLVSMQHPLTPPPTLRHSTHPSPLILLCSLFSLQEGHSLDECSLVSMQTRAEPRLTCVVAWSTSARYRPLILLLLLVLLLLLLVLLFLLLLLLLLLQYLCHDRV